MKKNLIFLTLLISVLMVSVVSAGITGYALSLREGRTALAGDLKVSNVQVKGGVGSVDIEGVQVSGREGETVTTSEGASVIFQRVKSGGLFSKPKIDVVVTPAPVSVITETEEECSENCQTFTEVHKVEEGQTISLEGESVSISFISATEVILLVNNLPTALLSEGDTFEIGNGRVVVIKEIKKLEVAGSIGLVELGVLSSYKLKEGQTISLEGESVSISFISATEVILLVNNLPTALLSEGDTFEILGSGQIVTIQNVAKLEVAGNIGWVIFNPSACYFPNF